MKNNFKIKLGVGICTSIIGNIILEKKIDIKLNDKLGELWWVAPILSHIILTNYIIKENKKQ